MQRPQPLRPKRVRSLAPPFGWIPFRLLSSGLLAQLDPPAKLLYFFLCLVADRYGLSFYGEKRLSHELGLQVTELQTARRQLSHRDLLAFDGRVYQLLSFPTPELVSRPRSLRPVHSSRSRGPA